MHMHNILRVLLAYIFFFGGTPCIPFPYQDRTMDIFLWAMCQKKRVLTCSVFDLPLNCASWPSVSCMYGLHCTDTSCIFRPICMTSNLFTEMDWKWLTLQVILKLQKVLNNYGINLQGCWMLQESCLFLLWKSCLFLLKKAFSLFTRNIPVN